MINSRIPTQLLEELESRFPEKCPDIDDKEREIWFYSGQRNIVAMLRLFHDAQQKKETGNQKLIN